jgi:hypothetical protein
MTGAFLEAEDPVPAGNQAEHEEPSQIRALMVLDILLVLQCHRSRHDHSRLLLLFLRRSEHLARLSNQSTHLDPEPGQQQLIQIQQHHQRPEALSSADFGIANLPDHYLIGLSGFWRH